MSELLKAFLIALGILAVVAVLVGLIVLGSCLIEAGRVVTGAIILFLVVLAVSTAGVYYVRHD